MANSNNRQVVPEAKAALNQMKLEIANELGMANYDAVDKGNLNSIIVNFNTWVLKSPKNF